MKSLPKVELHVHIEGTLEPELIFAIAERNQIALGYDIDALRKLYEVSSLQSFLDLYYANLSVLQTRQDFADLTRAYLRRAKEAGVWHAEIFVDPQAHTSRGIPLQTCMGGIADALTTSEEEFGISTAVIVNFLRDRPVSEALALLRELLQTGVDFIGIGLDSAEVGHPPADFAEVFALAAAGGLRLVAHAGEEGPPEYVWQAIQVLNVSRIDHGIRSLEDPELVEYLVSHAIPLTVCPLSNVRLRVVNTMLEHPLPRMLEQGLMVTVNSDDPAYFGGYIDDNFASIQELDLTTDQFATLAYNAVRAAFLTDYRRETILGAVDAWRAAASAPR